MPKTVRGDQMMKSHWVMQTATRRYIPVCNCAISLGLKKDINNFAVLIYGLPKVVLLAVDLQKNFVKGEGIAVSSVLSLQTPDVYSSEFDAPQTDRFAADSDASFG
ncbi:MAG: hypothetical protein ACI9GW_003500 [Halieaceae bacterium]|jgi:hypothetical protein